MDRSLLTRLDSLARQEETHVELGMAEVQLLPLLMAQPPKDGIGNGWGLFPQALHGAAVLLQALFSAELLRAERSFRNATDPHAAHHAFGKDAPAYQTQDHPHRQRRLHRRRIPVEGKARPFSQVAERLADRPVPQPLDLPAILGLDKPLRFRQRIVELLEAEPASLCLCHGPILPLRWLYARRFHERRKNQ
jgi:hypothetical protein